MVVSQQPDLSMLRGPGFLRAAACALTLAACAVAPERDDAFNASTLAAQIQRRPIVLLGEIHDNAPQHEAEAQALARVLEAGLRPALAFEQFDRERQADIDRVLADPDGGSKVGVERLVALGAHGWNWNLYRPLLELALRYRLPIVAADLSRADATRVSKEGLAAVLQPERLRQLGLAPVPADLLDAQEQAVEEGHCHEMPSHLLPGLARAQIARDATLALSIHPYLERGVILFTGDGHARRDIGVPRFLPAQQRDRVISIALIERDEAADAVPAGAYDAVFRTAIQPRPDPCAELKKRREM